MKRWAVLCPFTFPFHPFLSCFYFWRAVSGFIYLCDCHYVVYLKIFFVCANSNLVIKAFYSTEQPELVQLSTLLLCGWGHPMGQLEHLESALWCRILRSLSVLSSVLLPFLLQTTTKQNKSSSSCWNQHPHTQKEKHRKTDFFFF